MSFIWVFFAQIFPIFQKTQLIYNSQSAAFGSCCEASSAPLLPLASLAKARLNDRRGPLKKRLDLQVKPRPRMASEVGSEVTRSP